MSAFSLQRINPRLTGNIKLVVTADKLYLESINSTVALSRSIYKGMEYNVNNSFGQNVRKFTSEFTNLDDLFSPQDESLYAITNQLKDQYHQIYDYGCYSSEDKIVQSKFRFFAPLHITESDVIANDIPDRFIIYRIAPIDPSITAVTKGANDSRYNEASRRHAEALTTGELVASFDMKRFSNVFKQLKDSYVEFNFEDNATISGLNVLTGNNEKVNDKLDVDRLMANERTFIEFENVITNLYHNNNLLYSNVINFEFCFDEELETSKFWRYVGFYVKDNNVTKTQIDSTFDKFNFKLLDSQNGLRIYTKDDKNALALQEYYVDGESIFASSFGGSKPPMIALKINFNPSIGQQLILTYANINDIVITITKSMIGSIAETRKNLVDAINEAAKNAKVISVTAYEDGQKLIIQSNINNLAFENIIVTPPPTIEIIPPVFSSTTYNNTFYGAGNNTITSLSFNKSLQYSKIRYVDDTGVSRSSNIKRIVQMYGQYSYDLQDALINKKNNAGYVWLVKKQIEQPIIASVIDHRIFDFDNITSEHADVLDFDLDLYKAYLESIVNSSDYIGRLPNTSTAEEIAAYKQIILSTINAFFNAISVERDFLIKNIDVVTSEATTTKNEYDRLSENSLVSLSKVNKLIKFINKWQYSVGSDVYNLPYRLNNSLAFRYDNFSPSTLSSVRDIRYHTHGWPIIGEGSSPYLIDVTEENVHKHLGYSRIPLSEANFLNNDVNAYQYLEYSTKFQKHTAYSKIQRNPRNNKLYTFFKGLYLEFDDQLLEDYKFSLVLLTKLPTQDDRLSMHGIRNDVFKTLTIICRFYIPDPILTSAERGSSFYYLDRSLLYFSNTIYSTTQDTIDFGQAKISLTLYDELIDKFYAGTSVGKFWSFYDGKQHIFVSRGDASVFRNSFKELLDIDSDFSIFLTDTQNSTNSNFGIVITFKNIQQVENDFFWCEEIVIKSVLTNNTTNTPAITNDDTIQQLLELNVYEEYRKPNNGLLSQPQYRNLWYISRAIAFENANYQKIVRSNANVARYSEISTANISKILNDFALPITTNDGNTLNYNIDVIKPTESSAVISLQEVNGNIKALTNPYVFPMLRYSGLYKPVSKILNSYHDDGDIKHSLVNLPLSEKREMLKVSTNISSKDNGGSDYQLIDETYDRALNDADFFELSEHSSSLNVQTVKLPWITTPIEFRSYVSIVLNSTKQVVGTGTINDNGIELAEAFYDFAEHCLTDYVKLLSEEQIVSILSYLTGSTIDTYNNFVLMDELVKVFVDATMSKLYTVDTVTDSIGRQLNFFISNNTVFVTEVIEENSVVMITISRN